VRRQAAISKCGEKWSVYVRERVWGFLWWTDWRRLECADGARSFGREQADHLAEVALEAGWIPGRYESEAIAIDSQAES
jgi:hypothetical protein